MVSRRKARPSVDGQPIVISAPTLQEAYRKIKLELGDEAVILGSRNVTRRQSLGLGNEKLVEVMIQAPDSDQGAVAGGRSSASSTNLNQTRGIPEAEDLVREVERIEELVQAISDQHEDHHRQVAIFHDNPLAETLLEGGTSAATVEKLMTRFISETGKPATDRVGAITWLTDNLRASNCDWEGFYGCHAFLGRPGCGRTNLIYQAAAKLQELGRKTLVLLVMPENKGEVRRLQTQASVLGFDAAIIQQEGQLARSEGHLARYDAVLVDLPALSSSAMALGGSLHTWLATNPSFHRHLVLPLECDPSDMTDLTNAAKEWHGDWIALSRCDLTAKTGKLLDFANLIPLPLSLVGEKSDGENHLAIASSGNLVDRVLGTVTSPVEVDKMDGMA